MDVAVKMIGMVWMVVLAMQLVGFLTYKKQGVADPVAEHDFSYRDAEEGEATFS